MSGTARLSSDGARVLCVMVDCGMTLAWTMEPDKRLLERERFVWFPPGWATRRDGVWSIKARSRRRLRYGRSPQAVKDYQQQEVGAFPPGWVPVMPCEVVCPACGMRQILRSDALGIPPALPLPPGAFPSNARFRQLQPGPEVERWEREPLRFY